MALNKGGGALLGHTSGTQTLSVATINPGHFAGRRTIRHNPTTKQIRIAEIQATHTCPIVDRTENG